ncbi:hypothetical protein CIL05_10390 [Virgibacillus profundi]|uniref:Uncharacterized protein n=1 Tax=Virgibacillus profundi TaxID=2024555 RepID=A0A2A2IET4_9BACI|nr:hypothetical protein [Virgibacillus profundi]PAV29764.1 hypothetical protein CIL05_10390 [Virgibacillus profundi]PXY53936.1 hypothetical protein CIT14_10495 [Virgibacillus profundi]
METLPGWFLIIFLMFLFLTFIISAICYARAVQTTISVIALILSLAIPLINLVFSAQRSGEMNGYEYLIAQLQDGNWWAILIIVGYVYLIVWWVLFINKQLIRIQFYQRVIKLYKKLSDKTVTYWKNRSS